MKSLGQLMMFGVEGTEMTPAIERFIKRTGCGGIILFRKNVENPKQIAKLIRDMNEAAGSPLMMAVDQEGGRVIRMGPPFTQLPAMAEVGRAAAGDPEIAFLAGRVLGRELSAVGFNVDFAPVLDVATNPANPVIGDRALSPDAAVVAKLGCEMIRGIQDAGVAACGKHFPGHGDTDVDSHKGLPVVEHTRARFEGCELVPFRAAIEANVAAIMTAHLLIPNLDPDAPATISRRITTGLLRDELKFQGVIFTDDLIMKGIADLYPPVESAWRAIRAGADVAIACHGEENALKALEGLGRALDEGRIDVDQVAGSLARVAGFKARYCCTGSRRQPMSVIGCREHEEILKKLKRGASR